jgi:DNA-binding NarL/FixJ family response regulator/chromosome segregation ATPase
MPKRTALVVDEDTEFGERLAPLLSRFGVEARFAAAEDEALDLLRRHGPEVVFIAVDAPDKEGFALFSKVKKARRRLPVVIATSTVSKADMKLHEKLKVHAEAYLDKRELTDDEILEVLRRLGLGETASEDDRPKEAPAQIETEPVKESVPEARSAIEPWLAALLDPETTAILADIDEEGGLGPKKPAPDGAASPERVAALEEEVERLENELEQTRRDAQSSPFSSEFLGLREEVSRRDKEIRRLREALGRRDGQVVVVKTKLADFARRSLDFQKAYERGREQVEDLKSELEALQARLARAVREAEDQDGRFERETQTIRERLAEEQVKNAVARRELESELSTLRATHARTVQTKDAERAAALEELERRHQEQKTQLADELKARYSEKLKEIQSNQERALATLREEHQSEIETIHAYHYESAARAASEAQEALRQASEKSAFALERANAQRRQEAERAEEKRRADVAQASQRHGEEVEGLTRKYEAEKGALERHAASLQTQMERLSSEIGAKVQDVAKQLEEERRRHQETREHYEQELAQLQSAHTKHLEQAEEDQFSALAGLSRKFRDDRNRILEMERHKWEETAKTLHQDHARALEGIEQQYLDDLAAAKSAHEAALRQKDSEAEQERKLALDRVRAELVEEIERGRRKHADELAALRQEHEREVSSIQASHMESIQRRERETQQALREAVEAAKAGWAERLDRSSEESAQALAAQRHEYEEEIATLEKAHQEAVAKREGEAREALRRAEEEREEARAAADRLQAGIAELEARLRSSAALTEERHKAEMRDLSKELKSRIVQIEDEKQFLAASVEKLKRQSGTELARALDSLAHEKKLHQASQDRYERRLAELNARHAEGIKQIENDWMAKFGLLEKSFEEKNEKVISNLEREWKARLEKERFGSEEATRALTRDFEMELATVRQQLERTRALEETYQAAARDLTAMKARLDELTRSLARAHQDASERERALEDQKRRNAENVKTIDSLKAVIDDFSRSVEGYMRDREESDQTISSLKAVIDDFYRSIEGEIPGGRKN